jgi:hypothetical protein
MIFGGGWKIVKLATRPGKIPTLPCGISVVIIATCRPSSYPPRYCEQYCPSAPEKKRNMKREGAGVNLLLGQGGGVAGS